MHLWLGRVCVRVCAYVCVVLMIFQWSLSMHSTESINWLASVAKHSVWQEAEEAVISAKTLMENLTQIENVGVYA